MKFPIKVNKSKKFRSEQIKKLAQPWEMHNCGVHT